MHQRRIIRDAWAARLIDANIFGDRVFKSREAPANVFTIMEEGPMCNVYARSDTIKPDDYPASGFDGGVMRTLELAVEITATGAWVVDDKLDDFADEVEALFEDFEVPGLPAAEARLMSTEIDSTDDFEQVLGGAVLMYEVRYWRPFRTDKSETFLPCEAFVQGRDGIKAAIAACGEDCGGGADCNGAH